MTDQSASSPLPTYPPTYLPTYLQAAFNASMSLWFINGLMVFFLVFTLIDDEAHVQVGRWVGR